MAYITKIVQNKPQHSHKTHNKERNNIKNEVFTERKKRHHWKNKVPETDAKIHLIIRILKST